MILCMSSYLLNEIYQWQFASITASMINIINWFRCTRNPQSKRKSAKIGSATCQADNGESNHETNRYIMNQKSDYKMMSD